MPYPATSPWTQQAAAKYISCSDITGCEDGSVTYYDFELVNTYEDAAVWAFSGGLETPTPLARTPTITFTDLDVPLRGHITRLADPSQMLVVWNSRHNDDNPAVQWGYSSGVYTNTAFAESTTYTAEDLCGEPATTHGWFPPHWWLYARITGLQPGSGAIVYYRYGSAVNGWSEESSFMAPPAPGPDQPLNILACADMGVTELDGTTDHWAEPDASLTAQHMLDASMSGSTWDYSLVVHAGDISYATGYQLKWELYASNPHLANLIKRVPYMIGTGNHETDWPGAGTIDSADSGGECGIATHTRFPVPVADWSNQFAAYYVLVQGPMTMIMLNSELAIGPGSEQYAFLQAALAGTNRSVTPWVTVWMHRPIYYVTANAAGGVRDSQFDVIEPLLIQYQVDLVLVGHVHNTYASCPLVNGTCVEPATPGGYAAPVHVSIGNAGQGLTPINATHPPSWATYQASVWGYSTLHMLNSTFMTVNLWGDTNNTLLYSFDISRQL